MEGLTIFVDGKPVGLATNPLELINIPISTESVTSAGDDKVLTFEGIVKFENDFKTTFNNWLPERQLQYIWYLSGELPRKKKKKVRSILKRLL